jgi:solute carrier family 50 protein (sugar transporter)
MRSLYLFGLLALIFSLSSASALNSISPVAETRRLQQQQLHIRGGALSLSLDDAVHLAETLAPKVGILTSTALYFAPAAAVLTAVRSDEIGDLNPLPLAIMSVVSVAWLAYGLSARDPYVALSNIAGCVGSIGYVVGLLPLLKDKGQLRMTQAVVVAGSAATLGLWTFLGLSGAPAAKISSALGLFASGLFILLSGSPLSTIKAVFSTRNSGSILGSLTIAQVVNTALWSAYGLAVKNRFVWGPNIVVRACVCLVSSMKSNT